MSLFVKLHFCSLYGACLFIYDIYNKMLKENNQRLAKNTLFLYFRMLFLMLVTLYTSRVTLQVLGVTDFGIYNIVGGVVVLFAFLSRSLNSASVRFLSVAVGRNNEDDIQETFSTSLTAHIYLMLIVVALLESLGLWFVLCKLNIPQNRQMASILVYQIAVLSVCFNIIRIPFNASIIANEKMGFYALSSIVEGVLKLIIVWMLLLIPIDKLVMYSLLIGISILVIDFWYIMYCKKHFVGNRICLKVNRKYLKQMLSFSGWNLFNGVADIGFQQGTNIILNIFYGVTLNTTMGITNQVRTAIYSFVANLQTAANPQIIKNYASNNFVNFQFLIFAISKYSFYLMLLFSIPLILNMDFVLELWLGSVPDHTIEFTKLILLFSTIDSLVGPIWVSFQASGKVKWYSIFVSLIVLVNVPLTYFFFKFGYAPETMLYIRIGLGLLSLVFQILYLSKEMGIKVESYIRNVLCPITFVTVLSIVIIFYSSQYFEGWYKLLETTIFGSFVIVMAVFICGINKKERIEVLKIINKYIKK